MSEQINEKKTGGLFRVGRCVRVRRRHWRAVRRILASVISLMLCLGLEIQQTRADYWLLHGMPTREYVSLYPSWVALTGEFLTKELRAWVDRLGRALPKGSHDVTLSLEPGEATGRPWPWQALDPVGPFSGVNLANGNLYTAIPIVSWDRVAFSLFHNSMPGPFGPAALSPGWSHSYSANLHIDLVTDNAVEFTADNGAQVIFSLDDPTCNQDMWCDKVHRLRLNRVWDETGQEEVGWKIIDHAQNALVFTHPDGQLTSMVDSNGDKTTLTYEAYDQQERLVTVTDPVQRSLHLRYDNSGRLVSVEAPPIAQASEESAPEGGSQPVEIERVFEFNYAAEGLLEKIHSPRRFDRNDPTSAPLFHITLGYSSDGLKLKLITDYEGNGASIFYNAGNERVERIDHPRVYDYVRGEDVVTSREYSYSGGADTLLTEVTDERGGISRYLFDAAGRLTRVQDQLRRTVSRLTWTDSNRPKTMTNVLGGVTTIEYDANENPESTTTPRGGTVGTVYDDLNRLTEITDPVGNVTEYLYDQDNDPLMLPRTILGPVDDAPHSTNYNRIEIDYGGPQVTHHALPTLVKGPNNTAVAREYADGNPARTVNSDEDDNGCSRVESTTLTGATGEERVTGTQSRCEIPLMSRWGLSDASSGKAGRSEQGTSRRSGEGPVCPEEEPVSACPVCGCERDYNQSGSVVRLSLDSDDCPSESTPVSAVASLTRLFCPGGEQIEYDGNERITCVEDWRPAHLAGNEWDVRYTFSYDALGRPIETEVLAAEESREFLKPLLHVRVYPSYRFTQEYADTAGEFRTIYYRELHPHILEDPENDPVPDHIFREIKTVYKTDAAGRIISVERDGAVTKYTYQDSTVAPAVRETRPDGSYTDIYLDPDGAVRGIEHRRADGEVLAAFEYKTQDRDAKGRIERSYEDVLQPDDTYRRDKVEYEYGDGNLQQYHLDVEGEPIPNPDKVYYRFLPDLGERMACGEGDPNRVVTERRTIISGGPGVEYQKKYWYDQGGNRLAMRVSDPVTGEYVSITRYNYFYEELLGEEASGRMAPGTPRSAGTPVMDYEGRGFNKLLSTQTHFPGEPDRIDVVVYSYGDPPGQGSLVENNDGNIASKVETTWRRSDDGKWNRKYEKVTDYGYERGQLHRVYSTWIDYCPEYCDGDCDENCEAFTLAERAEYHLYDVFGRRIAHNVCHAPQLEMDEGELFKWCKSELVHFDYAGLSNQVIAERRDPYIFMGDGPDRALVGDRYVSTYTYGPLGLIMRTAEMSDADPTNNRNHYYLSDVMGGNTGLYMDDDGDPDTDRVAVFQQFDAFGNDMTKPLSSTSSFAWRGQEGSVTDRASGLVYMQARHYDPSIGRFIQADALAVASFTTQGMNRYIYCENDPVNNSDPTGKASQNWVVAIAHVALALILPVLGTALLIAATAGGTFAVVAGIFSMFAGFFGGLSFLMSALGYFFPDTACTLDPASVILSLIATLLGIPGMFSTGGRLMQAANMFRAADLLGFSNTAIDAFVYDW